MVQIGPDPHGDSGKWMLPGGGIEHGEEPCEAVVREVAEETGYTVAVDRLFEVGSDHRLLPSGIDFHGVFVLYAVSVLGGEARAEVTGHTTAPCWVPLEALPDLPMLAAVRGMLARALA
ncbi:MAG: NUDIX domain-containing protein [Frankiaceae bacterium]|nr:NUDIX domain-containing protein [Frankiaceae bacterium]